MIPVSDQIRFFNQIWNNSPVHFPDFMKSYSSDEQKIREAKFSQYREKLKALQDPNMIRNLKNTGEVRFFPVFRSFLETVFDFKPQHLSIILSEDFKNVSKDFYYQSRKFDPDLKPEDIYQALRNVWIINGLQLMMGLPVEITPSVFAYSLMYPYSDNFIDDPRISGKEKLEFSERFKNRLHGECVTPLNFTEEQLFRLVEMVEGQYPRNKYTGVYKSLYAIHHGQTKSLLLTKSFDPDIETIQSISFEKGGTSVLADGYLAAGNLMQEEEKALFGYGIYLQLLDDIQDIRNDNSSSSVTLFTANNPKIRQELIYKTVHFGRKIMQRMEIFNKSNTNDLIDLMNYSIETMLIESVGLNCGFYPAALLEEVERHSPMSFSFIRKSKEESRSQRFELFRKYFEKQNVV
jgi:hypothetical protein